MCVWRITNESASAGDLAPFCADNGNIRRIILGLYCFLNCILAQWDCLDIELSTCNDGCTKRNREQIIFINNFSKATFYSLDLHVFYRSHGTNFMSGFL